MIEGNEGGFVTDSEGRLTGGVKQINANVIRWLNEAGKSLPPGWHADVAVGPEQHTQGTYTGGAQSQVPLGMAADIRLVDPNGNIMPHMVAHNAAEDAQIRASPEFKIFQKLGDAYIRASGGQGRWGGYYGLADTMQYGTVAPGYPAGSRAPPELYQPGQNTVTPTGPDNRQLVFNTLVNQVGLTPQQALGALYSLGGESGSRLSSTAVGPGGDFGIAQWTGVRKQALDAYAASYGKPNTDPQIQAQFLAGELLGNDPKIPVQAGALAALKTAQTAQEANQIWTAKFEVPKVDNSGERFARGAHVGSLDAQGNLVLGDGAGGSTTPGTAYSNTQTPGAAGGQTPGYPYVPMTPEQRFESSMGQILANLGTSGGGVSGGGEGVMDAPDQPAIRMPALDTQVTQTPSPVPAQFAGGVQPGGGLGSQLSALTAPLPDPEASLTQGAPSMTSLLGTVGTPDTYNMMDPRRTITPSLTMRTPRLA